MRRTLLMVMLGWLLGWALPHGFAMAEPVSVGDPMIVLLREEPRTLAVYHSIDPSVVIAGAKLFDGLLDYDELGQPVPALAERWEVAGDGLAVTFHLRAGVTFHDGQPFTSADVRFSMMDVLKQLHPRGKAVLASLTSVETPDDLTAVLRLDAPAPYLLHFLGGQESPMLPRTRYLPAKGAAAIQANPLGRAPIGTGPFKFAHWTMGRAIALTRNLNYWQPGLPRLSGIEFRFCDSDRAAIDLMLAGAAHVAGPLSPDTARRVHGIAQLSLRPDDQGAAMPLAALVLNTARPPFDDPLLRSAVAIAFNRPVLVDAVWAGFAQPIASPLGFDRVPNTSNHMALDAASLDEPADRANALLDQGAFPRQSDGTRFAFVADVAPWGEEWQMLGAQVQVTLAKLGIKASLRYEPMARWLDRVYRDHDFTLTTSLTYRLADPALGLHRVIHGDTINSGLLFGNASGWHDAHADRLMDQAMIEPHQTRREQIYRELGAILDERSPMIWLARLRPAVAVAKPFRHVIVPPLGLQGNFARAERFTPPGPSTTPALSQR